MTNTEVGLKIICFGSPGMFFIPNNFIGQGAELLLLDVCGYFNHCLSGKTTYASNRPF